MINTIFFDLDGTLLSMWQEDFIKDYFKELTKKLAPSGLEPRHAIDLLWKGTDAMLKNDGSVKNSVRFWHRFAQESQLNDEKLQQIKAICDDFYSNEFNKTAAILADTNDAPRRAVTALKEKGYRLVLATNPIFPPQAVTSRLGWIGLSDSDFVHTTNYDNTSFCKPNPGYYNGILAQIGASATECMMVGNSVHDDMCAANLGFDTYFVTGYPEGADGVDISQWKHGTIEDFAVFAQNMPAVSV